MLGDLGGVTEVIMLLFGFFLFPISEYSYVMRATSRLFLARTKENDLFAKTNTEDRHSTKFAKKVDKSLLNVDNKNDDDLKKEMKKHRVIKISFLDNLKLYVSKILGCEFLDRCFWKRNKLMKLYD